MHYVAESDASADIQQFESAESDRTLVISSVLTVIQQDFEPKTWDIFWRSSVLGHRTSEIAEEYQMTGRAVRQAKHRVMNRLREECLRHGIAVDGTS